MGLAVKTYHKATRRKRGPADDQDRALTAIDALLTRSYGNEDLEDGSLGITIADGGRDRGKPFDRVALGVL